MKLSNHFELDEFIFSNTAIRNKINNSPSGAVTRNLQELCINVLEPIRLHFNKPVIITSGYRSEKLNKLVGGAKNSQHLHGQASDIIINGIGNQDIIDYVRNNLIYDQVIDEFNSWVHISYVTPKSFNRKQFFRIG